MTLQELQQAIYDLSTEEQLILWNSLTQVLRTKQHQTRVERRTAVDQLRGCLKQPAQPTPTNVEIERWREERLESKYLS
jgi:hypothetical protein